MKNKLSKFIILSIVTILIVNFIHNFKMIHAHEITMKIFSINMILVLALSFASVLSFFVNTENKNSSLPDKIAITTALIFGIFIIGFFPSILIYSTIDLYMKFIIIINLNKIIQYINLISQFNYIIIITSLTVSVGIFLFSLKKFNIIIYGSMELITGLIVNAVKTFNEPTEKLFTDYQFHLAILTAGIYLTVRGIENIDKGCKEKNMLSLATVIKTKLLYFPIKIISRNRIKYKNVNVDKL